MLDFARCDLPAPVVKAAKGLAWGAGGFAVWLLCLPVICFAGLAVYAIATGYWPREATMLYLALGHLVGLI